MAIIANVYCTVDLKMNVGVMFFDKEEEHVERKTASVNFASKLCSGTMAFTLLDGDFLPDDRQMSSDPSFPVFILGSCTYLIEVG